MLLGARQGSLSSRPLLFQFQGAPRQSPTVMLSYESDEHLALISALLRGLQRSSGTSDPIAHLGSPRLQLMRLSRGHLGLRLSAQAKVSREADATVTQGCHFC